ncbi:MAG TPA: alpha/beta fold hydrolase [Solirubrobacteraceae bacterium]|nr:alpha/beta fold hydrolase [Solirubrobacteraceae bacterium]
MEFAAHDGTRLVGTLTPGGAPAALILSGSGPLDRDSNMKGQALNVGNALAEALAARGAASLRYDKRGVGESGGDYLTTGFERETDDARAALDALDADAHVVIGHSVGATIAIRLAAEQDLAGVVLLAAAARPGAAVMQIQSERIAATVPRLARGFFLRRQTAARRKLLESTGDVARVGFGRLPARWFREYMAYDPVADIRAIRCPVLAITGRSDLQVDPAEVGRIGELVTTTFTGESPDALTHLLRLSPDRPSLRTYAKQLKDPVDPALLERVARWVSP